MGSVVVDMNNTAEVITAGHRVLNETLGAVGARIFLDHCAQNECTRPRITAAQFAEAMERGKARAEAISASVGGGRGNYTEDRHKRPERTHEEVTAGIMKIQEERAGKMKIVPRIDGKQ